MKLKGIELKGTYRVGFHDRCFKVYDENDNLIYYENIDGFWAKKEYDERDNLIYYEDSAEISLTIVVASIKLELKLAKSELKNAKRLEKLRKRQEKENKENEQYLEELQ